MKNFKKIGALLFLSAYLIIGFSFASPTLAADVHFVPQISIPGSEFQQGVSTTVGSAVGATTTSSLIARYIAAFYKWGLSIVGVLAVLMLMAGGVTWLTSGGDSGRIGSAKKMISGSIFGTLLLLGAYFFLNTINPDLTKLPPVEMANIEKAEIGCCDIAKDDGTSKMTISNNCKNGFSVDKILNDSGKCESTICCVETINASAYKCSNIFTSSCPPVNSSNPYSKEVGKCSDNKKCTETTEGNTNVNTMSQITTCTNIANGEHPTKILANGKQGLDMDNYCYNNRIYYGDGKIGEPCGNETPNGKCYSTCPSGHKDEWVGGRDCTNSKCCILSSQ